MEACHGHGTYEPRAEDIHLFVEAVIDHEVMCHADTVGFHGMALAVVVVAHLGVVEVRDATGVVATAPTATTDDATATAASTSDGGDARGRGGGGGVGVGRQRSGGGGGSAGDSGGR